MSWDSNITMLPHTFGSGMEMHVRLENGTYLSLLCKGKWLSLFCLGSLIFPLFPWHCAPSFIFFWILLGLSYFPSFSMRSLFYFFLAGSLADYVGGWPLEQENPPKLEAEDVEENLLDDTHSFKSAIQMMDVTESRRDLKKWQAGRNY